MRVLVTGGIGYVGYPIVRKLLQEGYKVRVFQRGQRPLETLKDVENTQVEVIKGNILDAKAVEQAAQECQAILHLVGIIREDPRQNILMDNIHRVGTHHIVEAAKRAGVPRIVHMSALGARRDAISKYHQSKWEAEEVVRNSQLEYTIFRPSVIFGKGGEGPNFLRQLGDLVQKSPVVPIPGNGLQRLQPVSIDTVASVFCAALKEANSIGKTYDLAGSQTLTYLEILRAVAKTLKRPFYPLFLPFSPLLATAKKLEVFSWFPITSDQLQMLKEGNVSPRWKEVYSDFHLTPLSFQAEWS